MTLGVILVLNAGTSSLKARVFEASADLPLLASGRIIRIGIQAEFSWNGVAVNNHPTTLNHADALRELLAWIQRCAANSRLCAGGHRILIW